MKATTMSKIANGIQLLWLSNYQRFTRKELSEVSGVGSATIKRNKEIVSMLIFALTKKEFTCQHYNM